jgi:hypothetical protein
MADMGAGQISGTLDFVDLCHSHAEVFLHGGTSGVACGLVADEKSQNWGRRGPSPRNSVGIFPRDTWSGAQRAGGEISRTFSA